MASQIGRKSPWLRDRNLNRAKEDHPSWKGGKPNCLDCGRKLSLRKYNRCRDCAMKLLRGSNHPNYTGGPTERHRLMGQKEYIIWRTAVFMRDDYTCVECGQRGGDLEADHIKPWALYPELRYAIDNGRTLCKPCHRQTDTYGNRIRQKYDS